MSQHARLFCIFVSAVAMLLSGCSLFRDDRPDPSGSPYGGDSRQTAPIFSEAEAVNAAVSAVSLKMAVSSQGPFRIIPKKGKVSTLGFKMIGSLSRMGLSRLQAPCPLYLEDCLVADRQWTVTMLEPSGKTFYHKTFILRGK